MGYMGSCGNENCGHGCCCYCRATRAGEHCPWCNNETLRCGTSPYCKGWRDVYVCFVCRESTRRGTVTGKNPDEIMGKSPHCGNCKKGMARIWHFVVRFPAKRDVKGWDILRRVVEYDFSGYKAGSRGRVMEGTNIFPRIHLPASERAQFWVPKHAWEFDEWLQDMKKPFVPHPMLEYPLVFSLKRKLGH